MRAKLGIVEGVCNTHLRCIPAILRPPDEVQKTPRNVMTEQELLYGCGYTHLWPDKATHSENTNTNARKAYAAIRDRTCFLV